MPKGCRNRGVPEVARDLAQDALIEAAHRWDTVKELDRPGAWLRRVTINKSISWQRREARGRAAVSRLRPIVVDPPSEPADEFWRAVRDLPPRQRTAVVLRYVDDASTADIAAAMDVTDGTVKASLSAARRSLAQSLGLDDRGRVVPDAIADLAILDAPTHLHIAYRPDADIVAAVVKRGEVM